MHDSNPFWRISVTLFCVIGLFLGLPSLHAQTGRQVTDSLKFNGFSYRWVVCIPPQYNSSTPLPVVFDLHPAGWDSYSEMGLTHFYEKGYAAGFFTVYPAGVGNASGQHFWNAGICCGDAASADYDDVGFFRALIAHLALDYAIHKNRIYAMGVSNGGMMSNRLGSDAADLFAAVCGIAGGLSISMSNTECKPSQPVSVIEFHALDDGGVPYNGQPGWCPPINTAMAVWATADGCNLGPITTQYNSQTTKKTWSKSNGSVEVTLYSTQTGGHSYPPAYVPATDLIWDFFQKHPLDNGATISHRAVSVNSVRRVAALEIAANGTSSVRIYYAILYDMNTASTRLSVHDMHGRLLESFPVECIQGEYQLFDLSISNLSSGVYLVSMVTPTGIIMSRNFSVAR